MGEVRALSKKEASFFFGQVPTALIIHWIEQTSWQQKQTLV